MGMSSYCFQKVAPPDSAYSLAAASLTAGYAATLACGRHGCAIVLAAVLAAGTGCGPGDDPEDLLRDYVGRLQNLTEVEVLDTLDARSGLQRYPPRRERRLALGDVRIGLLDFLALHGCGLQQVIGERNSALGRVMAVSQQLLYEHRLLLGTRRCQVQLADDPDAVALSEQLAEVAHLKGADLPKAYWNATFASPEFEHMFSLAAAPLPVSEAPGGAQVTQALLGLAALGPALGSERLEIDSTRLEDYYQVVRSRRMAGELLGAIDLLRFYLDAAAEVLERRLAERPLCYKQRPTPRARNLDNVFRKFYAGGVQVYLARVDREAGEWLRALDRLFAEQRVPLSPVMAAYRDSQLRMDGEGGLWRRYRAAVARHARAWQRVFDQCGLAPGA